MLIGDYGFAQSVGERIFIKTSNVLSVMGQETLTMRSNYMLVAVMVLVNDERNGCFKGRVDAISVGEMLINIQRVDNKGTRFDYFKKNSKFFIKFGRMKIEIHSHRSGVGNWCWDEVDIDAKDAAALLNYLRRQPTWSIEEGWTEFYDKWDEWDEFTEKDFIEVDVAV